MLRFLSNWADVIDWFINYSLFPRSDSTYCWRRDNWSQISQAEVWCAWLQGHFFVTSFRWLMTPVKLASVSFASCFFSSMATQSVFIQMKWSPYALGWSALWAASKARSNTYAYCKHLMVFLALLWTKLSCGFWWLLPLCYRLRVTLTRVGLTWQKRGEQKTTSLPAHRVLSFSIKCQDLVKAPFKRSSLGRIWMILGVREPAFG